MSESEAMGEFDSHESLATAASELFIRLRGRTRRSFSPRRRARVAPTDDATEPFGPHRDPRALGNVVGELSRDMGWNDILAASDLVSGWPEIVGPDIAANTTPEDLVDGVLRVSCSSTSWATQLRLLSSTILTKVTEAFPEARVTGVSFRGPTQPSWKHGIRTVPGRGPRDTYG